MCEILPSPIFSLVLNTDSGVFVFLCNANVFRHSPLLFVSSLNVKTSYDCASTGTFDPTRSLSSQYANSHHPGDKKSEYR